MTYTLDAATPLGALVLACAMLGALVTLELLWEALARLWFYRAVVTTTTTVRVYRCSEKHTNINDVPCHRCHEVSATTVRK
jgi:hypothetical protein